MITAEQTKTASGELILAVADDAPRSRRARDNLRRALEAQGTDIEPREIDLLTDPELSLTYGIMVTPALIHVGGGDNAVLYGDLSDEAQLTRFLKGVLEEG